MEQHEHEYPERLLDTSAVTAHIPPSLQGIGGRGDVAPDNQIAPFSITTDELTMTPDLLRAAAIDDLMIDTSEDDEIPYAPEEAIQPGKKRKHLSPFQASAQRFRQNTRAMICMGFMLFLVLLAFFGPPIYQHIGEIYQSDLQGKIGPEIYHRYDHQELSKANQGPSAQYILGTDNLGEDLLARMMQGMLISIIVALLVEIIDIGFGVTIGVLAGYYGGWIDNLLARFTDLVFAFPGLLFAILLTGIFGQNANDYFSKLPLIGKFLGNGNASLVIVSLALATVSWPLMARYVRGQTLQIKEQVFVDAARSAGARDSYIMFKHIVPSLLDIVIVTATLNIANTIIGEATLSLLGLGVVHPGSSLGLMVSDGIDALDQYPWITLFPTIVLTAIVLAISFISDGLRDAFDPHTQRR